MNSVSDSHPELMSWWTTCTCSQVSECVEPFLHSSIGF
jgi:hypothetical protein